ncbi:MAG: 1-deoxy-D-xylulose-5-phosphate reductoisomerase [Clostridiales bacterium]|jgi:1-deoxy-D-xylulose-5-phosphate reductoisomerase|nr:1-deoxy-D-xylulose-5-phosphate reductoisomerase [Clostridiales bacterium]
MQKSKNLIVLGSTGSIGTQTLDVAEKLGCKVVGLSCGDNIELLSEQIKKFAPKMVSVKTEENARILLRDFPDVNIEYGEKGACKVAQLVKGDMVVSAMVGVAGIEPTKSAIKSGKTIALANKEVLVTAGDEVMKLAKDCKADILPIDSEHSAIFECIRGFKPQDISRIIITASGGAFRDNPLNELNNVTAADALKHPNWTMGAKITIDCATMMNKAFEVIEAHHLFGLPYDKIDVVLHRESIIHSMVEFVDGSVIAQLAMPDMRLAIANAITYPNKQNIDVKQIDFTKLSQLSFADVDKNRYPCFELGVKAGRLGGDYPLKVNKANDEAVAKFLKGEINFLDIQKTVEKVFE